VPSFESFNLKYPEHRRNELLIFPCVIFKTEKELKTFGRIMEDDIDAMLEAPYKLKKEIFQTIRVVNALPVVEPEFHHHQR